MFHGNVLPGEQRFDSLRWHRDHLWECHNDDALWGFTLRAAEEVRINVQQGVLDDLVLLRLFHMGIGDWAQPDHRSEASTPAMRHTTVLASRILDRVLILENEVRVPLSGTRLRVVLKEMRFV